MHDPSYRRLFAFPRMVEDLLRTLGDPDWLDEVDFGTLERLSAEQVGDLNQQRRGDAVWRVRSRHGWIYLLLLLEFQSTNDVRMALRNLEYTALLYRELGRAGELAAPGEWPPVLPVVLYNGDSAWSAKVEMRELIGSTVPSLDPYQPSQRTLVLDERHIEPDDLPLGSLMRAVVALEQSQTPADIVRVATALRDLLRDPGDSELGRAFVAWMQQSVSRMEANDAQIDLGDTLEEATMTLGDRMAEWPEKWRQEGRREGHREGHLQGRREGRREGIAQRAARERALLRRLAAMRFGARVGEQVEALVDGTDDWDRLAAVNELVVQADSGTDLLDRMAAILRPPP